MDNGDPRFPYPRFLRVPCVIVPEGSPPPLEWMAAHPHHFTIPGFCIPPPPAEADVALEPRPEAEGQADPPPEEPTFLVEIDYAGNFIARPVAPLTLRPAAPTETPSAQPQEAEPEKWQRSPTPADPPPGPMLDPHPKEPRPDDLRRVAPPGPRRARGGPPPLGPNPAATGMDPLSPEFTRNLMRQTTRIMADMDQFSGTVTYPTMHTPEALSTAVHAGMQHLAAHNGDISAAITSAKAAGAAGRKSVPKANHAVAAGTISAAASGAISLPEIPAWLVAVGGAVAGAGLAAGILFDPTPAGAGEEEALRAYRAQHAGAPGAHGFEPPPPSPPLPGLVPPPLPQTKPGEGGFTPAPPMPPLPGFTPSPPSVTVHPGRPIEANKPIVVEAKKAASAASPVNPADLAQLRANGVKFNPAAVIATGRDTNGEVVFLETGNPSSGLKHIIDEHGKDFKNIGVSGEQILLGEYRENHKTFRRLL